MDPCLMLVSGPQSSLAIIKVKEIMIIIINKH